MFSALCHPALADCRQLFLRNYEMHMDIGVHDFEKQKKQRVMINIDLFIPLALSTPNGDLLNEVVDYDFIVVTLAKRVARGHIHLLETLCDDVIATLLEHPKVRAARISMAKPDLYPACEAVGVEVFRIKEASCKTST
jgi:dihydroneopterin aldolase